MTDNGESRKDRPATPALSRRRLLATTGVGLAGSLAGFLGATETATASALDSENPLDESPGSQIAPNDGFARIEWFDDDVDVATVTNLDGSGSGSLRAAAEADGPRLVVFEVSGRIDLESKRLDVGDRIWIAGQTAPSPGVALTNADVRLTGSDSVVQHVRVRPGDESNSEPDTIRTDDGTSNNVIDHCSATWSVDENVGTGYETTATTFANCLVGEPLHDSKHRKGPHGYNMLVGDNSTGVAVLGNVFAHGVRRNVRLKAGSEGVVANNLVYHFREGTNMGNSGTFDVFANGYLRAVGDDYLLEGEGDGLSVYYDGVFSDPEVTVSNGFMSRADSRQFTGIDFDPLEPSEVASHALTHAGARPADRTHHDVRLLDQVRDRTGSFVDSQDDVGGYPDLDENTRSLDVPDTGKAEWLYGFTQEVEVGVHTYANDDGTVTDGRLRQALADWQNGDIDTPLLERIIAAW